MGKPGGSGRRASESLKCGDCGEQMNREDGWKDGDTVYHCVGGTGASKYQGEVHHVGAMLHPLCWHCGRIVGCIKCAGIRREALCMACAAWVTVAAFVQHGAIVNTDEMLRKRRGLVAPQFDEYPEHFRQAYLREYGAAPDDIDPKATFKQLVGIYLR
jgi:hypothetical protein